MKIVFMTSGTINSSLSYRALAFAKELTRKGHKVYIVCPSFDKYSNFVDENLTKIGTITIVRPLQPKFLPFELSLIPYIITSIFLVLKINPDIIHIYKANPITIGGAMPLMPIKTIVLDVDDLDTEVMKIEHNSKFKIKLVELSEKICLHFANNVVAVSKYLHEQYIKKVKDKHVTYIPNGAEFSKKIDIKDLSTNRIVFIGNINRINILQPLFYSVKSLINEFPELSITIIGDGKYFQYFQILAKKLHIESHIIFLGHIPRKQLSKYVKTGDIGYCYMPNERTIKACSSMKVFQYMQYGVIPLVSKIGDLPLYAFSGKAGYVVDSNSIIQLTASIRTALLQNSDKQKKLQFAITYAPHIYKWSVLANTLERTYKNIL